LKSIAILGSTGSIGRQTLDVVDSLPGRFHVVALAGGSNVELLAQQVCAHRPKLVAVASEAGAQELSSRLRSAGVNQLPAIEWGASGLLAVATSEAEMVVSAAVGVVGLPATFAAVQNGKHIALANKEVLVAAGALVIPAARNSGSQIIPVDSEHNAIHQCLRTGSPKEVRKLILTASGGPFRKTALALLETVTPEQALNHPNWNMGRRITIDSATMMNKGFEVIEAHWLFGVERQQIEVILHPQSTIHSMVEFVDGSIVAQLGRTDMRMPIQYALTWPERLPSNRCILNWKEVRRLDFARVSTRRYPCLRLAREALRRGGLLPCALNAADEIAVEAFLAGHLRFSGIAGVIEEVLGKLPARKLQSMEDVVWADGEARRLAREEIAQWAQKKSVALA
jgi:1-deoxy-D-xylulose-5-phosphate reductoisomerase